VTATNGISRRSTISGSSCAGRLGEDGPQLDHQRGRAAVGERLGEAALLGGARADPHPGRQQHLAARQQRGDVRDLAGVDPAQRPVELGGAGDDLGQAGAQGRQLQRAADGDRGEGAVVAGGHRRGRGCHLPTRRSVRDPM
jgi:hypothetical protein